MLLPYHWSTTGLYPIIPKRNHPPRTRLWIGQIMQTVSRGRARLIGYLFALAAGALWGTTGPLSTALYTEGAALTDVGFWRVLLSALGLAGYGLLFDRGLFRFDRRALLLVGLGGGVLVAIFEVGFQYAIAGVGVAPAVALLYTAPVTVAILARIFLGEALTLGRIAIAVVVMIGVALTVTGYVAGDVEPTAAASASTFRIGLIAGLLTALSYAGTTLLARYAVPRYGAVRVLFLEIGGGALVLAALLPLSGHTPQPATTAAGWIYIILLGLGAVLAANFCFFAGVRRIDAAPTAIAASIEPVVGAILALLLFDQRLTTLGWLGLVMVVAGVANGNREGEARRLEEIVAPVRAPAHPQV
jgi:DME family drug/metabolite transporter